MIFYFSYLRSINVSPVNNSPKVEHQINLPGPMSSFANFRYLLFKLSTKWSSLLLDSNMLRSLFTAPGLSTPRFRTISKPFEWIQLNSKNNRNNTNILMIPDLLGEASLDLKRECGRPLFALAHSARLTNVLFSHLCPSARMEPLSTLILKCKTLNYDYRKKSNIMKTPWKRGRDWRLWAA